MRNRAVFLAAVLATLPALAATAYDLATFLKLVESDSKDLRLAREDVTAAETDIRAAYAAVLPKVGANGSYLRNFTPLYSYIGGKMELPDDNNQFQLGVQASQNLFNLQALSGVRASGEARKLSQESYGAQRVAILTGAKKAFYAAILAQQVYKVRKDSEDNAYENYQNVQRKFESGLVSELAVLQAEVAWKTKVPETTLARKNLDVALLNLKALAGLPTDAQITLEGSLEDYPPLPGEANATEVLGKRPDYQALETQRALRQIAMEAAQAQAYPVVGATLMYGFSSQSDKFAFQDENNALQLQLNVNVPIYSGGYVASQVAKARSDVAKAEITLDKRRQDISIQLDELTLSLREAHERILSAQTAVSTAEKALAIAETSFNSGLATQLDRNDAQLSYDSARLGYYSAIYDYLSAVFDWQQATGAVGPAPAP